MARAAVRLSSRSLWQYSHSISIFTAALLFLAGFLCMLLWTNGIVATGASSANWTTNTFTHLSPAVSTFNVAYGVAIFGAGWNSILFVVLIALERDRFPISTEQLRYEVERAACVVAVVGNALYSLACFALMATLARLAADPPSGPSPPPEAVLADANARRAGQGVTAAMAGLAAAAAVWAAIMDWEHMQNSQHRQNMKQEGAHEGPDAVKEA